jgi:hypothetical protein
MIDVQRIGVFNFFYVLDKTRLTPTKPSHVLSQPTRPLHGGELELAIGKVEKLLHIYPLISVYYHHRTFIPVPFFVAERQ